MAEDQNEEEQMIINQEYKVWKKEAPYKYDFAVMKSLEWPSTTFQWLPDIEYDDDFQIHYAIISSNSAEFQQSELQRIRVLFPKDNKNEAYLNTEKPKIQIVSRGVLGSEINRARYCYSNPLIVATSHANAEIMLTYNGEIVLKLISHTSEGYGLSWNPISFCILASGQSDKKICVWDVQKNKKEYNKSAPILEIIHHNAPVEDIAWHKMHTNIFSSCSDDRLIMIWDIRFRSSTNGTSKPLFEIIAHTNEVYTLDFSPFNEFLLLSGSGDETISIWDMRNLTRSLQTFKSKDSVVKVQWSPSSMNLFGSCGYDRKVNIWDLSNTEKSENQESLFSHDGHRSRVIDFDWNKNERFAIGSIQQSNCLHIWEMRRDIYYAGESEQ